MSSWGRDGRGRGARSPGGRGSSLPVDSSDDEDPPCPLSPRPGGKKPKAQDSSGEESFEDDSDELDTDELHTRSVSEEDGDD